MLPWRFGIPDLVYNSFSAAKSFECHGEIRLVAPCRRERSFNALRLQCFFCVGKCLKPRIGLAPRQ